MNAKHTPGPWDARPIRGVLDIAWSIATTGRDVAYVYGNAAHGGADARLIAAAPDLLAALEHLEGFLASMGYSAADPLVRGMARVVIAKATSNKPA